MRFVRKRHLPGLEPDETGGWFEGQSLDELDVLQLEYIAAGSTTRLDAEEALERFTRGGYADHLEYFAELGAVPLEQWDVFEDDELVCHVWLYGVDGGIVFRAGTREVLGGLCQSYWDPYEGAPDGLGDALEEARVAAVQEARANRAFPCELNRFRFGSQ